MIQKLRVENWGHFDSYEVDFSQGTNCLFGANQSGKTTLLNAICFGLTGKTLSIKTKSSNYIKMGSKKPIVELDLQIDGNQFRVIRDGLRSASLFEIEGDMIGEELAAGVTDVKQEIMERIDSKESFIDDWVFFREGEISHFLQTSTPTNRRKTVSGFVNVRRFEEIAKIAGNLLTPRKSQEKFLKQNLDSNANEMDRMGDKELEQLESEREEIEAQLSLSDKYDKKKQLESRLMEYPGLKKKERDLLNELGTLKGKQNEESNTKLSELSSEEGSLSGQIETLYNNLELLTSQVEEAECPTCGQHIAPQKKGKIIGNLENEIGRINNLKKGYAKKIAILNQEIESQDRDRSRINSLEKELVMVEEQKKNMATLEEELQSIRDDIDDNEDLDFADLSMRLDTVKQEISDMNMFDGLRKQNEKTRTDLAAVERERHYLELLLSGARYTIDEMGKRTLELVQDDTGALLEKLKLFKTGKLDIQSEYLMPTYRKDEFSIEFANLSASEKLICLISMRISLIKKLSNLDFIILDDPALQLDDGHTKLLAEHFRDCGVGQVILSSSKPSLRDENWDTLITLGS